MTEWHAICDPAELEDGKPRPVAVAGKHLLAIRSGDDVHVVDAICSHAFQELECGMVRNGWIACPAHGSRFDLATGEPMNPPAIAPIATYETRVTDGVLEVEA